MSFGQRTRVDFNRFKQDFYADLPKKVGALLVWRAINTHLKGSIEAYQSPSGMLSKKHFLYKLGKNRCRISPELRLLIYEISLRYQQWLLKNNLWDNCDRIRTLGKKIEQAKMGDPTAFDEINISRIYVDARFSFAASSYSYFLHSNLINSALIVLRKCKITFRSRFFCSFVLLGVLERCS